MGDVHNIFFRSLFILRILINLTLYIKYIEIIVKRFCSLNALILLINFGILGPCFVNFLRSNYVISRFGTTVSTFITVKLVI